MSVNHDLLHLEPIIESNRYCSPLALCDYKHGGSLGGFLAQTREMAHCDLRKSNNEKRDALQMVHSCPNLSL